MYMFQRAKEIQFYIFDKSETQYININSIICILKKQIVLDKLNADIQPHT